MNGYVEAGYVAVLAPLAVYAGRLEWRRRTLERRLPHRRAPGPAGLDAPATPDDQSPDEAAPRQSNASIGRGEESP